jgi:hypothetical protein
MVRTVFDGCLAGDGEAADSVTGAAEKIAAEVIRNAVDRAVRNTRDKTRKRALSVVSMYILTSLIGTAHGEGLAGTTPAKRSFNARR